MVLNIDPKNYNIYIDSKQEYLAESHDEVLPIRLEQMLLRKKAEEELYYRNIRFEFKYRPI